MSEIPITLKLAGRIKLPQLSLQLCCEHSGGLQEQKKSKRLIATLLNCAPFLIFTKKGNYLKRFKSLFLQDVWLTLKPNTKCKHYP